MLNFDEELKSFRPIEQAVDVEKMISSEPLVDLADVMKEMIEKAQEEKES